MVKTAFFSRGKVPAAPFGPPGRLGRRSSGRSRRTWPRGAMPWRMGRPPWWVGKAPRKLRVIHGEKLGESWDNHPGLNHGMI